jgi:hypothetical protein
MLKFVEKKKRKTYDVVDVESVDVVVGDDGIGIVCVDASAKRHGNTTTKDAKI